MIRWIVAIVALAAAGAASAAELKVLTAGAFKPVLLELLPAWEAATGDKAVVDNDTAGGLIKRIEGGEVFDLVVLTKSGIADLTAKGRVASGSGADLARVGIGVGVKAGAPRPDLSSADAFKRMLLDAPSVAYIDPASGGSSGIYLAGLFERMGIAEALKRKSILVRGGLAARPVADGSASVALQQASEIQAVAGVDLIGMLPAEIQNYTVYSGGISAGTQRADAARRLLAALAAAGPTLRKHAMEAPR